MRRVKAQFRRGGDLVDILAARAGRQFELELQFVFVKLDNGGDDDLSLIHI